MARMKLIGLWLITCLMALVMVGPGLQKFTSPVWQRMFRSWGFPEHFYLVIGAIEVIAGLGLLIPRTAAPSAAVLSIVMIGAAITQLTVGGRNGVGEIVLAALLGLVAYARREPWLRRYRRSAVGTTAAAG
jgi:putative oxidoreductase